MRLVSGTLNTLYRCETQHLLHQWLAAGPPQFYLHEPVAAGRVQNILVRMPGTASTGAILLIGNYDSMPTTPGAGDPDTSAAVVLETVRALQADPHFAAT